MPPPHADEPLRVVIIDDHAISRCAYGALLRSEGVDVLAELASDELTDGELVAMRPHVVIVDARPGIADGLAAARAVAASGWTVAVISSARASSFGRALDGFAFIPKADVCRAALIGVIAPGT